MRKVWLAIGVVSGALTGVLVTGTASAYDGVNQGLYRISPKLAPHKSLDLPGWCPGLNNAPHGLGLYHYDAYNCNYPATDQKWYVAYTGSDGNGPYYTIYQGANGSSECLDVTGGSGGFYNGNQIGTWSCNGGDWQHWYFTQVEPGNGGSLYGQWKITSRYNTSFVLDLAGCNTENGNPIQLWGDNNGTCNAHTSATSGQWVSDGQEWILMRADLDMPVEDWSDDFTSLNTNTWNVESHPGLHNGELETFETGNVYSDGRKLHVDAHYTGGPVNQAGSYTSGRLNTKNKATFQNGAWSASFHYWQDNSANHGAWPALWLLGNGISEDQYSDAVTCTSECGCGVSNWPMNVNGHPAREIDYGEWMNVNGWTGGGYPNHEGYTANAIWGSGCQSWQQMMTSGANGGPNYGNPDATFDPNNWATFKVQYDEGVGGGGPQIKFFNNGNFQQQWGMDAFYNQPYFAIINLAIGGNGGGDASGFNNTGQWASIQVDWIAHERWCTGAAMNAGTC